MEEDWIITGFEYHVKCEKCERCLTFVQNGDELRKELLEDLLELTHRENIYDSYYRYFKNFAVQVDVEIEGNGKCDEQLKDPR